MVKLDKYYFRVVTGATCGFLAGVAKAGQSVDMVDNNSCCFLGTAATGFALGAEAVDVYDAFMDQSFDLLEALSYGFAAGKTAADILYWTGVIHGVVRWWKRGSQSDRLLDEDDDDAWRRWFFEGGSPPHQTQSHPESRRPRNRPRPRNVL